MASASKTPNLNLPQWVGTEKPERTDFNAAFDAIDDAISSTPMIWTTVTSFSNSWVDRFPSTWPVQYSKDASGIVRLRGCIKSGLNDAFAFILPEGYRPSRLCMFATVVYANASTLYNATVHVNTAGEVYISKTNMGVDHYTPLDCCQFATN